ncbi:hypothetical protein [Paenibacillus sp. NPDC057934]|uniref:hypothetical protein n=1 Tax=Paenibacillus sp. NPDC057934 TaxID=3346282 RepID=UPI0036DF6049
MTNREVENGLPTSWEIGELAASGERIIYPGLTEEELHSTMMYNLHLASSRSIGNGYVWYNFKDVPILQP